jgi:hypothetical protein
MSKKKSMKGKGSYAAYRAESRAEKNRAARLAKHLKSHPNDKQTARAKGKAKSAKLAPSSKLGRKTAKFVLRSPAGHVIPMPLFGRD